MSGQNKGAGEEDYCILKRNKGVGERDKGAGGETYSILKRNKRVSGESYGMKLQKLFGKILKGERKGEMGWV